MKTHRIAETETTDFPVTTNAMATKPMASELHLQVIGRCDGYNFPLSVPNHVECDSIGVQILHGLVPEVRTCDSN